MQSCLREAGHSKFTAKVSSPPSGNQTRHINLPVVRLPIALLPGKLPAIVTPHNWSQHGPARKTVHGRPLLPWLNCWVFMSVLSLQVCYHGNKHSLGCRWGWACTLCHDAGGTSWLFVPSQWSHAASPLGDDPAPACCYCSALSHLHIRFTAWVYWDELQITEIYCRLLSSTAGYWNEL